MRFFSQVCVSSVLVRQPGRSSCIAYTLRFSARNFLALAKKSLFLRALYISSLGVILTLFTLQVGMAQGAEIRDPMEPPAFALQKFRQAKWKNANRGVKKTIVAKKPAAKAMQLTSILYSPERKIAIIDDQTLRVGDAIRNAKLIKINKDSVRLMKKGKVIVLLLNDELIAIKKIKVERKL
ncbi:MAG: hypothetical protein ACC663_02355 [Gammaproteobacteria bacterium]